MIEEMQCVYYIYATCIVLHVAAYSLLFVKYFHQVSEKQFINRYEEPGIPVVITCSQLDWQANKKWTMEVSIHMCISNLQLSW